MFVTRACFRDELETIITNELSKASMFKQILHCFDCGGGESTTHDYNEPRSEKTGLRSDTNRAVQS